MVHRGYLLPRRPDFTEGWPHPAQRGRWGRVITIGERAEQGHAGRRAQRRARLMAEALGVAALPSDIDTYIERSPE